MKYGILCIGTRNANGTLEPLRIECSKATDAVEYFDRMTAEGTWNGVDADENGDHGYRSERGGARWAKETVALVLNFRVMKAVGPLATATRKAAAVAA